MACVFISTKNGVTILRYYQNTAHHWWSLCLWSVDRSICRGSSRPLLLSRFTFHRVQTLRTRFVNCIAQSVNNKQKTPTAFHHSRWLQPRKFKDSLPKFYQHVNFATRGNNTLDFVYTTVKNAYKAVPRPHLGYSDHISVMLIPAYIPLLKLAKPVQKLITIWPENATSTLQDCFQCTDWNMFKEAATYNNHTDLQEYTETVTAYIKKCMDDVTVTKTITTRATKSRGWQQRFVGC